MMENGEPDDTGETKAPQDEISAPLVFQCSTCKAIVGDSFNWIASSEELNAITLSAAASSVTIANDLETSTDGPDLGSTFSRFRCACGQALGRMYRTTARSLDQLRDLYTFDLERLSSYQLGTGTQASPDEQLTQVQAATIMEELEKLQHMILVHQERLDGLTQSLQAASPKRAKRTKPKRRSNIS
eukprot:m.27821 g.27821  ORF g.27821 m.27821 type:complete len:186 (+) comp11779_c0_seq2:153-710(+)